MTSLATPGTAPSGTRGAVGSHLTDGAPGSGPVSAKSLGVRTFSGRFGVELVAMRGVRVRLNNRGKLRWVSADEVGDHGAQPLARVLLQEVAGSFDHGMLRPAAPGTVFFRTGAIAPVIGSRSLNATRNGLSQTAS